MTKWDKMKTCLQHNKSVPIMICGECEYVCNKCTTAGWYSTAGCGGGTYHVNTITGESINPNQTITFNMCLFDNKIKIDCFTKRDYISDVMCEAVTEFDLQSDTFILTINGIIMDKNKRLGDYNINNDIIIQLNKK